MSRAAQRIGHWLDDDTNRYAARTVSMILLAVMFSGLGFMAGERAGRAALSVQLEQAASRNYRMLQQIDCDVSDILDVVAPDPKRKRLERCRK